MSFSSPEFGYNPEAENEDPRRDLLVPGPILRQGEFDYREFEKGVCAQTFTITISNEGIVAAPLGQYIPQNADRVEWEDHQKLEDAAPRQFETAVRAEKTLEDLIRTGSLRVDRPLIFTGRIALGTIYTHNHPETGEQMLNLRINNDPFNSHRDEANPNSGMIRTMPTGFHPAEQLRASLGEIIPSRISPDGKIIPYIPINFGGLSGGRARREYKTKVGIISGQEFGDDMRELYRRDCLENPTYEVPARLTNTVSIDFQGIPIEHGRGISLGIKIPGKDKLQERRHLLAASTRAGALECMEIVQLSSPPETFHDPQYGSKIITVSVNELTEYLAHIYQDPISSSYYLSDRKVPTPPPIRVEKVIDGATGKPTESAPELGYEASTGIMRGLRFSPPLKPIVEYFHRLREITS